MAQKGNLYISGHSESVLQWYSTRTAADSAAYLLALIRPDMHVLDIGCGPGTISADLAELVPQGKVIGVELGPVSIDQARNRNMANECRLKTLALILEMHTP